ncbi:MAG: hypothetical protein ACJ79H_17530 [Myxococcales bacterium]
MAPDITSSVVHCARCGGDHPDLTFKPLTIPIELGPPGGLTHWAPCPTNGEPILMHHEPELEEAPDAP